MARPSKAQLINEIASTRDGIDITRGYAGSLMRPTDSILRDRGGGNLDLYKRVLADPQCHALFGQRQGALIARDWTVTPASDRRVDKKAAEFIEQQLKRVRFDHLTKQMHYAVWYGYAVAEIVYKLEGGQLHWDRVHVRDRSRFRFDLDGQLRMLTRSQMTDGIELPQYRFWSIATGADHDDEPYGLGIAHHCYWPVHFKRQGLAAWLRFLDKFASPTVVGKYDPGTKEDQQAKLLQATQAVSSDSGVIIPKSMMLEFVQATRSGTADYSDMQRYQDQTISKVIAAQTMTSENGGSRAQADTHHDVFNIVIVKADADLINESFVMGPVRWLVEQNFPDAEPPTVSRMLNDSEDLNELAARDVKLAQIGFVPTLEYVHETYGSGYEQSAPVKPTDPATNQAPEPPAEFAADEPESPTAKALADFLDPATAETSVVLGEMIEQIRTAANEATSLGELSERVLNMFGDLPVKRLGQVMELAFSVAALQGLSDARDEVDSRA